MTHQWFLMAEEVDRLHGKALVPAKKEITELYFRNGKKTAITK
jgi:hypothetical protein